MIVFEIGADRAIVAELGVLKSSEKAHGGVGVGSIKRFEVVL